MKIGLSIHWIYYLIAFLILVIISIVKKKLTFALLVSYVFLILASTLMARTDRGMIEIDLLPFRLFRNEHWKYWDDIEQVIDNMLMFIPVGLLGGIIWGKKVIGYAAFFSIIIEILQLIFRKGLCETDDVINNVLGVLLGYGLLFLCRKLKRRGT